MGIRCYYFHIYMADRAKETPDIPLLKIRVVKYRGKVTEEVIKEFVSKCDTFICAFVRDDINVNMSFVQAVYYAYFYGELARNPNIRLLQFLAAERNISSALDLAPLGREGAHVVVADLDGEKVDRCARELDSSEVDVCRGEFDAWRITSFALGFFK